ncbi:hypothetical protein EVAR_102772_1 [Eumeta japonica]|uniref:Uncharacterized protein n=1 Tax=Eumeta variegata TaxID=151549 RepID=A0A4C1TIS4_EUMVA|nr:hypothetical protein EVAR_102772_1 [Eumeta japonica]
MLSRGRHYPWAFATPEESQNVAGLLDRNRMSDGGEIDGEKVGRSIGGMRPPELSLTGLSETAKAVNSCPCSVRMVVHRSNLPIAAKRYAGKIFSIPTPSPERPVISFQRVFVTMFQPTPTQANRQPRCAMCANAAQYRNEHSHRIRHRRAAPAAAAFGDSLLFMGRFPCRRGVFYMSDDRVSICTARPVLAFPAAPPPARLRLYVHTSDAVATSSLTDDAKNTKRRMSRRSDGSGSRKMNSHLS